MKRMHLLPALTMICALASMPSWTVTQAAVPTVPAHFFKRTSFAGVSLSYGSSLAARLTGRLRHGTRDAVPQPPRIEFTAQRYLTLPHNVGRYFTRPVVVTVYRASAMRHWEGAIAAQIPTLRSLLSRHANLAGQPVLPYLLPLMDAAPMFHARERYVHFQNGKGISYLTALGIKAPQVENRQPLWYTFQGLTSDGRYVVVASFPVYSSILPDRISPTASRDLSAYFHSMAQKLNRAPDASFVPYLSNLDTIFQSLSVHPTGV